MEDEKIINLKLTQKEIQTIQVTLFDKAMTAKQNNDKTTEYVLKSILKTIQIELRFQKED